LNIEKGIMEELRTYFAGRSDVRIAYLFGSVAREGEGRDIDIAVLADDTAVQGGVLSLQSAIREDLVRLLGSPLVDVLILNGASLPLMHEVIACRRVLFCRDEADRVEFEARANVKYYDVLPLRRFFWRDLRRRIMEGTGFADE
jgi:predicted nucleotidyltransferase